ncbi:hypothetical protein DLAC_00589 [Tieghemostelium lacteum]|uniref:Uncharacterized protein n=1 Tax=Tieghemostelium lacteum TaxID=361077 RepID=A0A152AAJ8_TIELA|nr:hypothetical protein DLAC_00589 [Tieghemostelium lacteum]|eukprot:KYR03097.1 hypothetical protein DLAC_00589 [Tieghemostelium lacteum]
MHNSMMWFKKIFHSHGNTRNDQGEDRIDNVHYNGIPLPDIILVKILNEYIRNYIDGSKVMILEIKRMIWEFSFISKKFSVLLKTVNFHHMSITLVQDLRNFEMVSRHTQGFRKISVMRIFNNVEIPQLKNTFIHFTLSPSTMVELNISLERIPWQYIELMNITFRNGIFKTPNKAKVPAIIQDVSLLRPHTLYIQVPKSIKSDVFQNLTNTYGPNSLYNSVRSLILDDKSASKNHSTLVNFIALETFKLHCTHYAEDDFLKVVQINCLSLITLSLSLFSSPDVNTCYSIDRLVPIVNSQLKNLKNLEICTRDKMMDYRDAVMGLLCSTNHSIEHLVLSILDPLNESIPVTFYDQLSISPSLTSLDINYSLFQQVSLPLEKSRIRYLKLYFTSEANIKEEDSQKFKLLEGFALNLTNMQEEVFHMLSSLLNQTKTLEYLGIDFSAHILNHLSFSANILNLSKNTTKKFLKSLCKNTSLQCLRTKRLIFADCRQLVKFLEFNHPTLETLEIIESPHQLSSAIVEVMPKIRNLKSLSFRGSLDFIGSHIDFLLKVFEKYQGSYCTIENLDFGSGIEINDFSKFEYVSLFKRMGKSSHLKSVELGIMIDPNAFRPSNSYVHKYLRKPHPMELTFKIFEKQLIT